MLLRLFIASFKANLGRSLLALTGIALGVALGLAVHVINQSAIGEMQQATRSLSGDADLIVTSGKSATGGFDERVFASVLAESRIALASPVVEINVQPKGAKRSIKFIGIDVFRAARLQPAFAGEALEGSDQFAALRTNSVLLNQAARSQWSDADLRAIVIAASGREQAEQTLNIVGKIELTQNNEPIAVMDIAAAQEVFQRVGQLSRIDMRVAPGVRIEDLTASLARQLPAGVTLATPKQVDAQGAAVSRAYRINLTVLSLVALFTGGFLVFSTQSLSVVRRRSEFALLRTLGVTRRELNATLLTEGGVIGLIGGLIGVGLGLALASLALSKFGADLGSGFFAGLTPTMKWNIPAMLVFVALGICAGIAGAWLPARSIAADAPARALKASEGESGNTKLPQKRVGVALLAISIVLLLLPPIDDIPWLAYASIAAMLLGVLALTPRLSAELLKRMPSPRGVISSLAKQHVAHSPGSSSAGIAGVVASFSLMIAMLIMVISFRSSLEQWLTGVLSFDVYVRQGNGEANALDASTGETFQGISGVERADFFRYRSVIVDASQPERPTVTLIARPVRPDVLTALNVLQRAEGKAPDDQADVWISEAVADLYGFQLGGTIALPVGGVARSARVAGVWRDYARSFGAIIVDREQWIAWTGDAKINDIGLQLKPGADKAAVIAAVRALPNGERYEIADAAEIRKLSLKVFDRSFAVTYALELAAIFVGLAGISATFSAAAWARRREFGMLRHLGVTRREIARLLATEGALLGGLGAAIGLLLGVAIALVLIFVVNRQSFRWSMELHMPWVTMAILSVLLIVLTAISAVVSGRYAMSRQVVLAVKDDA